LYLMVYVVSFIPFKTKVQLIELLHQLQDQ
jgi:hypothetical protein